MQEVPTEQTTILKLEQLHTSWQNWMTDRGAQKGADIAAMNPLGCGKVHCGRPQHRTATPLQPPTGNVSSRQLEAMLWASEAAVSFEPSPAPRSGVPSGWRSLAQAAPAPPASAAAASPPRSPAGAQAANRAAPSMFSPAGEQRR